MPDRVPSHGGVLDPRLGVSNKNQKCETCHQKLKECTGHFGYIKLELPVFHIGYFRSTLQILQCICKTCARVLLTDKDRRMTAKQCRNKAGLAISNAASLHLSTGQLRHPGRSND